MADVSRLQGPSGPPESGPKRDRASLDPDKFKKLMEVESVDTEQKKKQSNPNKDDEDIEKIVILPEPSKPPPLEKSGESPLETKKVGARPVPMSPTSGAYTPLGAFSAEKIEGYAWEDETPSPPSTPSAQKTRQSVTSEHAPTPPPPPAASPSYTSAGQWDDESEDVPPPSPPRYNESYSNEKYPERQQLSPYPQSSSQEASSGRKKTEEPEENREKTFTPPARKKGASSDHPSKKETPEGTPLPIHRKAARKGKVSPMLSEKGKSVEEEPANFKKIMAEKGKPAVPPQPSSKELEAQTGTASELVSPKKELEGKLPPKKSDREEEETTETTFVVPPPSHAMSGGEAGTGDKEKKGQRDQSMEIPLPAPMAATQQNIPTAEPAPLVSTSPLAELPLSVLEILGTMVSRIIIMQTSGVTETTFKLNDKVYGPLVGASVKITTYDIAAGQINIEFTGSSQAIDMMQRNLPNLMAAFEAGKYNFTVKNFTFRIERPLFSRKEALRDQGEEGNRENKESK